MTKEVPIALITQEIPMVWQAVSYELGAKAKNTFLTINHSITGG